MGRRWAEVIWPRELTTGREKVLTFYDRQVTSSGRYGAMKATLTYAATLVDTGELPKMITTRTIHNWRSGK